MPKQLPILPLLQTLVAFQSTVDFPQEKQRLILFVKKWFNKRKIALNLFPHPQAPSLLVNLPGNNQYNILFLAHLDVVPAHKSKFQIKKKGDKLFGRGVLDDKGPVAILMLLFEKIKKLTPKNFPTIQLLLTTDEEIGGLNGAGRLVKKGLFKNISALIVLDGGTENEIVYKEKGIIHLLLEISGKSSHGSRPWLGENALEKAFALYQDLKNLFKNENLTCKNHWHPTVSLGKLQGGVAINQVPDRAEMGIDLRFTEKFELKKLERQIKKIIKNKAKILQMHTGDLFYSDPKHPILKSYAETMQAVLKKPIYFKEEHGASDARFFNHLKIPSLIHYPNGGEVHTEKEWISLKSLVKIMQGIEEFLIKIGNKDIP